MGGPGFFGGADEGRGDRPVRPESDRLEGLVREANAIFGGMSGISPESRIYAQLYMAESPVANDALKRVLYFSTKQSIDQYLSKIETELSEGKEKNNILRTESAKSCIDSYKSLAQYCKDRCGELSGQTAKTNK